MSATVFIELKFWLLLVFSFVVPVLIYGALLMKRSVSKVTVLVLGLTLVAIAGVDLYLLQSLATMAKATSSISDDKIFLSEVTVALYLFPALFAGVGVNVISDVLIRHLNDAESRFEKEHPDA